MPPPPSSPKQQAMKHDDGTSRRSQIQLGSAFSNLRGIPTDSNPRGVPTDFNEPYNAQYNAPYNAPLMGEAAQLGMNASLGIYSGIYGV